MKLDTELGIILICFMLAAILKGWFWLLVLAGPFAYSRSKLKYPRDVQKTSNLYAENRLLKFTVACLGIAVVISIGFSYAALR